MMPRKKKAEGFYTDEHGKVRPITKGVYVEGYKGQMIRVPRKCCRWCDDYDAEAHECMSTGKKVKQTHVCEYYTPRGQGGGE